jgi:hypothetical protein
VAKAFSRRRISLSELREISGILKEVPKTGGLFFEELNGPGAGGEFIPYGSLIEIAGFGKTSFLIHLLSRIEIQRLAWIEDEWSFFPKSFFLKVPLKEEPLFIEGGRDLFWSLLKVLESRLFNIVVVSLNASNLKEVELRKIQILSERSRTLCIFLKEKRFEKGGWVFRKRISRDGGANAVICSLPLFR